VCLGQIARERPRLEILARDAAIDSDYVERSHLARKIKSFGIETTE
jgi:hypothetical protein